MNTKPEASREVKRFIEYRSELNQLHQQLRQGPFLSWANCLDAAAGHYQTELFEEAQAYFANQSKLANRASVLSDTLAALAREGVALEVAKYEADVSRYYFENRGQ